MRLLANPLAAKSKLCVYAVMAISTLTICVPAATADQMTLFTCHAPNGQSVGHAGWTIARTPDQFMTASDTCGEGNAGSLHLELGISGAGYGNQAGIAWDFEAPIWATIPEYTINVVDSYAYPDYGSGAGQAAIQASDETDPTYDYRNLGGGSAGSSSIQRTPPDTVSGLEMNTACDASCPSGAVIARLDVSSVTLVLDDSTIPTVTNLAGGLVSGETLRDSTEATFTASDKGPGVYSAWLVIDGKIEPRTLLDSNNGWCTNLGQTTNGTRSFSHPDPCAESVSGKITFNTTALADGQHTVQLDVDDASGNTVTAYDATVTTHNAPAVTTAPSISGTATAGSTLTGTPGTFAAPEGAGAVSSVSSAWLRCSDAAATHCSPIPGTTGTTYAPTSSDAGYYIVYQNTVSDRDGTTIAESQPTLAVSVPTKETASFGGQYGLSSSTSAVGVSGSSGGLGVTSGSSDGITVNLTAPPLLGSTSPWQVTLTVHPHNAHKGTPIYFTGRVLTSPRPSSGKIVNIRARTVRTVRHRHRPVLIYGKWRTFLELHTDSNGAYKGGYRFRFSGNHTYQFSAIAPQEGGFLNTSGVSRPVTVHEH